MSNFIDYPINFSCADNEKRDYFKPIILFVNWQWCKFYRFELGSIDTCISYTTYIYSYKDGRWIDTFRTRTFTKTFADTGKYKLYVVAKNKCGGCDTTYSNFVTVSCDPTSGVDEVIKSKPKLIGMYDIMGRPVYHIRENEVLIYQYNDGTTRKILKTSK